MNILRRARQGLKLRNEYYFCRDFGVDSSMKELLIGHSPKKRVSNPYLLALLKIRLNRLG